jgi:hypothetical protein
MEKKGLSNKYADMKQIDEFLSTAKWLVTYEEWAQDHDSD